MTEQTVDNNINKNGSSPVKSFLTIGPTLHYSHNYVLFFYGLAVLSYTITWLIWSKLITGNLIPLPQNWSDPQSLFGLGTLISSPLNIFQYPVQMLILGLLMGTLAVMPILVSQLLSFRYSLLLVVIAAVLGQPVCFSLALLISCFGASCRPLRFRSRIVAIALCMAPVIVYWGVFGGIKDVEPVKAGFAYLTWIFAWITAILVSGIVLTIGHFTRYRPGLNFSINTFTVIVAFLVFQNNIGLAELDYQLYVAQNDPEKAPEFYDQNFSDKLDKMVKSILSEQSPFGFYPSEEILLRQKLKNDIQDELSRWGRWLVGFDISNQLNFQNKRDILLKKYDNFINPQKNWWMPQFLHNKLISSKSRKKRLPIALYYKGLLSEYQLNIRMIQSEKLQFHNDYAQRGNWAIWYEIYKQFSDSPESIEARYRIAANIAYQGKFERALEICNIALNMAEKPLPELEKIDDIPKAFAVFFKPSKTAITDVKLENLKYRLNKLKSLIDAENIGKTQSDREFLRQFVSLNPYILEYPNQLDSLEAKMSKDCPILDNVKMAKIMLIDDAQERIGKLQKLAQEYPQTDSGIKADYEIILAKIKIWKDAKAENGKSLLIEIRDDLTKFAAQNSPSYLAAAAIQKLNSLPAI